MLVDYTIIIIIYFKPPVIVVFFLKGMAIVATVVVAIVHIIYLKIVVSRLYKNKNKILQGLEMRLEPLSSSFFFEGDDRHCGMCYSSDGGHTRHLLTDRC